MNANEILYIALVRLRFLSGGKLCTIEPHDVFNFDGDEGVDVEMLLRQKAIIRAPVAQPKPKKESTHGKTTREGR